MIFLCPYDPARGHGSYRGATARHSSPPSVRTVADAHPRVRLKLVPMADRAASEKALVAGEADLAGVRSDEITSTTAQTIATLP